MNPYVLLIGSLCCLLAGALLSYKKDGVDFLLYLQSSFVLYWIAIAVICGGE